MPRYRTFCFKFAGQPISEWPLEDIEVDVCLIDDCGEPAVIVEAVWIGRRNILESDDHLTLTLAKAIKAEAEADLDWCAEIIADHGFHMVGHGGGEHWVHAHD